MKKIINNMLKVFKWIFILLIIFLLISLIIRFIIQKIILYKSQNNNEISEIIEVDLNNIKQKILIEGKSKDLPLLVILHGGPGMPILFGNAYRGAYEDLTKNFIVVEWDQYGSGNNRGNYSNLTINDYVIMGKDLIKYLKTKYSNNKIYLLGLSWGTVLGSYIVNEMPQYIDKYISYGTFTNLQRAYDYLGKQLLKKDLVKDDKDKLKTLMLQEYSYENLIELQKISLNYGLSVQGTEKSDNFIYLSLARILISPDYSISDIWGILTNNVTNSKIYEELKRINILPIIKNINIPFYIIQGKYDEQTPHYIIDEIVSSKENVKYMELKNSGHFLTKKDFKIFTDYLINGLND